MSRLTSIFKEYDSQKFVFVKPGGNYGDYLIYHGAEKLAHNLGIEYDSLSHKEFINSKLDDESVIYIHGGGGFNPWWSGTPMQEVKKASQTHSGVLICGPSTVVADESFIRKNLCKYLANSSPQKVHFLSRERTSFKYLKRLLPDKVEVGIDHDTALHLDATDLTKGSSEMNSCSLYAIRDDKERETVALKPKPFRLWFDPVSVADSFDEWVQYHDRAERIITNRLHSAILGTILGKRVTLLPNSYHKNRSVYSYCLEECGVTWKEKIEKTLTDRFLSALPSRITNSTKIARSMCALRDTLRFGATADR